MLKDDKFSRIPKVNPQKIPEGMRQIFNYWHKGGFDAKLLPYLTSEAFKINRISGNSDRVISRIPEEYINSNSIKLDTLKEELKSLYSYTQERLEEAGYNKGDKILLHRAICSGDIKEDYSLNSKDFRFLEDNDLPPIILASYITYAKKFSEEKSIGIEVDILSSWSRISSNNVYGIIELTKQINIENILYFNDYGDFNGPLESNEWLVINRTNDGVIDFNLDDINIDIIEENESLLKRLIEISQSSNLKELITENIYNRKTNIPPL